MKPLRKVVTAQDIESSLYYVHVDGLEDDKLREVVLRERVLELSNGELDSNTSPSNIGIPRKPLPASPGLDLGDRPAPPPKIYPHYQPPPNSLRSSTRHGREVAAHDSSLGRAKIEPELLHPTQALLGPRPTHQRLRSVDSAALEPVPDRQNMNLRRWSEQPSMNGPALPPRPNVKRKEVSINQSSGSSREHIPALPLRSHISRKEFLERQSSRYSEVAMGIAPSITSSGHRIQDEATSLTLIRRYNGLQWNVGKISTVAERMTQVPNHINGVQSSYQNEQLNGAVSIEITTPGYSCFANPSSQNGLSKVSDLPHRSQNQSMSATEDSGRAQSVFRRQLQASRHEPRPEMNHAPASENILMNEQGSRPSFNFRSLSHQSEHATLTQYSTSPRSKPSKPSKTKHYWFHSPWNGTCDFDVGILGRSIKCKHTFAPSPTDLRADARPCQVSELRFNLPSSAAFGPSPKTPSPNSTTSRETKRSSFFSTTTQHQRQKSSSDISDSQSHNEGHWREEGERMDLSLGQELAGGGFAGKQAKLGKLIVENEGLKMLDLVVAANVGLWWKIYGRVL